MTEVVLFHSIYYAKSIMTAPFYTDTGGSLSPLLQTAFLQYSNNAALTTFFENWTEGRAYIHSQLSKKSLLQALYQSQGAALLKDFIVGIGGDAEMLKSLAGTVEVINISSSLPHLSILVPSGDGWTAEDLITSINHNSQHYSKFYLAEHHIYGSSRVAFAAILLHNIMCSQILKKARPPIPSPSPAAALGTAWSTTTVSVPSAPNLTV